MYYSYQQRRDSQAFLRDVPRAKPEGHPEEKPDCPDSAGKSIILSYITVHLWFSFPRDRICFLALGIECFFSIEIEWICMSRNFMGLTPSLAINWA